MFVSVIIPTYNRKDALRQTLNALARQTYPVDHFEVIVVDDGSTDGTSEVAGEEFPFELRYLRQRNQGDAVARNTGVQNSQADIIVFVDDDILVEPDYIAAMVRAHQASQNRIVLGNTFPWMNSNGFGRSADRRISVTSVNTRPSFVELCSNSMSIRRRDYFAVGMMQGLDFPGSDIWCDVDFAYRAYQKEYEFYRAPEAVCYDRDLVIHDLESSVRRMEKVAYRAVALFQKYPGLRLHLPMFYDKTPLDWHEDPFSLIVRKLTRHLASSIPVLWSLERMIRWVERVNETSPLLRPLRRWILGGYLFRGYRKGLLDQKRAAKSESYSVSAK